MATQKIHIHTTVALDKGLNISKPGETIERWAFDIDQQGPNHVKIMFMNATNDACMSMRVESTLPAHMVKQRMDTTGSITIDKSVGGAFVLRG